MSRRLPNLSSVNALPGNVELSQSTVRNYLPTIYRKLSVRSRAALVELLNSPD
jgi:hypothetical protein